MKPKDESIEIESEVPKGIYIIDILIEKIKVAIEINGVYHYESQEDLNLKSKAKKRYLEALGYNYISIKV